MCIGPGNRLKFLGLRGSILVKHAFFGAASCREVTKRFVHPVSPGGEPKIKCVSRVDNLSSASLSIKASTELSEHQRHTVSFSVFDTFEDFLLVELPTGVAFLKRRFTFVTHRASGLAAVSVIVKDLSVRVIKTPR